MSNVPAYQRALDALRRREGLFRVLIFTLVTSLFWIGFSIFQTQQQTKVSIDIRKHTEPLNPNINRTVLEELAKRKKYTPEELQNFPLYERVSDDNGVSRLQLAGTELAAQAAAVKAESTGTTPAAPAAVATSSAETPASPSATPEATTAPEVTEQPAP